MKLFDMRDKTFVEALRAFLKEFRLPGEVCIFTGGVDSSFDGSFDGSFDVGRARFPGIQLVR